MNRVFAIGDLHLSGAANKPMNVFGQRWERHFDRIGEAWRALVNPGDIVLIPGDISWATTPMEAIVDLRSIGALPGTKVLLRGNHDHWWGSISKVRKMLPDGMFALQNDTIRFGSLVICGTRGWNCPGREAYNEERDRKYYEREVTRLSLSLSDYRRLPGDTLIAMMHFPPFNDRLDPTGFTGLLEGAGVDMVVYGHIHDRACKAAFEGTLRRVIYHLVSCDHLNFKPRLIAEIF